MRLRDWEWPKIIRDLAIGVAATFIASGIVYVAHHRHVAESLFFAAAISALFLVVMRTTLQAFGPSRGEPLGLLTVLLLVFFAGVYLTVMITWLIVIWRY